MVTPSGATGRIAVDAMGGDLGPAEVVAAVKLAFAEFPELNPITLVGDEATLDHRHCTGKPWAQGQRRQRHAWEAQRARCLANLQKRACRTALRRRASAVWRRRRDARGNPRGARLRGVLFVRLLDLILLVRACAPRCMSAAHGC